MSMSLPIVYVASVDRETGYNGTVDTTLLVTGVALQIGFASLVLLVPGGKDVFDALGRGFVKVLGFVGAGSSFIFLSRIGRREPITQPLITTATIVMATTSAMPEGFVFPFPGRR